MREPTKTITIKEEEIVEKYSDIPFHYLANIVKHIKLKYPGVDDNDIRVRVKGSRERNGRMADVIALSVTVQDPQYAEKLEKWNKLQRLEEDIEKMRAELKRM